MACPDRCAPYRCLLASAIAGLLWRRTPGHCRISGGSVRHGVLTSFESSSNDSRRTNAPRDVDRQTLAGVFVDDREALQLLSVGAGIVHKVIGPDVIGAQALAAVEVDSWRCACEAAFSRLVGRTGARSDAPGRDSSPLSIQKHLDAAIPITRIPGRQLAHRGDHRCVSLDQLGLVSQRRSGHRQQRARSSLRHPAFAHERDLPTTRGRGLPFFCCDLLHYVDLQIALGDQRLQLGVLLFQLPKTLHINGFY